MKSWHNSANATVCAVAEPGAHAENGSDEYVGRLQRRLRVTYGMLITFHPFLILGYLWLCRLPLTKRSFPFNLALRKRRICVPPTRRTNCVVMNQQNTLTDVDTMSVSSTRRVFTLSQALTHSEPIDRPSDAISDSPTRIPFCCRIQPSSSLNII